MRCKWALDTDNSGNGKATFVCAICEARFMISQQSLDFRFDGDPKHIFINLADCGTPPADAMPMLMKAVAQGQDKLVKKLKKLIADGKDLPPFIIRAGSWTKAIIEWELAGKPVRSDGEVLRIHTEKCKPCPHYLPDKESCNICGCKVRSSGKAFFNKIKMATQQCPDKPPRWLIAYQNSNLIKLTDQ